MQAVLVIQIMQLMQIVSIKKIILPYRIGKQSSTRFSLLYSIMLCHSLLVVVCTLLHSLPPHHSKIWICYLDGECDVCGGHSGTAPEFIPSYSVFTWQYLFHQLPCAVYTFIIVAQSVLWQIHRQFQSQFSVQYDLVFPPSASTVFSFL
jgi:hypothetical protein